MPNFSAGRGQAPDRGGGAEHHCRPRQGCHPQVLRQAPRRLQGTIGLWPEKGEGLRRGDTFK